VRPLSSSLPTCKQPSKFLTSYLISSQFSHHHILLTMKPRLLALLFAPVVGIAAGRIPHVFAQIYSQHMQLLDA
jgi:hypothetical protein